MAKDTPKNMEVDELLDYDFTKFDLSPMTQCDLADDRSAGDRPVDDRSAGDRPVDDRSAGDRPVDDRSVGDQPVGDNQPVDRSTISRPAVATISRPAVATISRPAVATISRPAVATISCPAVDRPTTARTSRPAAQHFRISRPAVDHITSRSTPVQQKKPKPNTTPSTKDMDTCTCTDDTSSTETLLSSNAKFTAISALAVSPDGVLHVADQGSLHILALQPYLPNHDENGEFRIPFPPSNEIYVFNRYGQHISTKDLTSGKTRYSFLYSKNTSFGKLPAVRGSGGSQCDPADDRPVGDCVAGDPVGDRSAGVIGCTLKKLYTELFAISNKRLSDLETLHDFIQSATGELVWLNAKKKTEIARDWSDKNLNTQSIEQYYESLMSDLEKCDIQCLAVQDHEEEEVEFVGNKNDLCSSYYINCHLHNTIEVEKIKVEEITDNKETVNGLLKCYCDICPETNRKSSRANVIIVETETDYYATLVLPLQIIYTGKIKRRRWRKTPKNMEVDELLDYDFTKFDLSPMTQCDLADDRSAGDRPVDDRSAGDRPVDDRSAGDRPVDDRSVGDQPVGDNQPVDRSTISRPAVTTISRPAVATISRPAVATISRPAFATISCPAVDRPTTARTSRPAAQHFRISRPAVDHITSRSTVDRPGTSGLAVHHPTDDPIVENESDVSDLQRHRGRRSGVRRQQERFMQFLYQLSSAHYNWGRRNRGRRNYRQ
ncbi:uncharacterized protein LOC143894787 [Temnothorax americanus]|uniref:uncharacterized protein LOC143894787 n=1 Tax=Temnothorax americanus TaxID=1964332 RepID=UPI00406787F8